MAPNTRNEGFVTSNDSHGNVKDPGRIVRRECGPGTGDEVVVTADGTRWLVVQQLPPRGTGDRQGIIHNGRVNENTNVW